MKFADLIFERKSLIFFFFSAFLGLGILLFFLMPREEDPRLKERVGVLKIIYPGAGLRSIEKLIAEPIEESLVEIPEIKSFEVRILPEVMLGEIRLSDGVGTESEINEAWKRVEDAIRRTEPKLPQGILPLELNRKVLDQDAILLAVTGNLSLLELKDETEVFRKKILSLPKVSKVNRINDPQEEVIIQTKKQKLDSRGITIRFLSEFLGATNHSLPPGSSEVDGKKLVLKTDAWFENLKVLEDLPIPLFGGSIVRLGEIATVERRAKEPRQEIMRWKGKPSIGFGIVAKKEINLIDFETDILKEVEAFNLINPNVKIEIINSQPKYVAKRLKELGGNLVGGILIVGVVLVTLMGFRLGFLASLIVPIISIISLGIYAMFGGVLHQISIAAFVMALGLLIDNVIVILESIQEKIDEGMESDRAGKETIREMGLPLLSATGTTLAAFIPMLGSSGNSADFTRAIPVINMLTLGISFLFALFVAPLLGSMVLKKGTSNKKLDSVLSNIIEKLGLAIENNYKVFLSIVSILFLLSLIGFAFLPKKFFPDADRDQLLFDLRLPEGEAIEKTDQLVLQIETKLKQDKRIKHFTSFVGRTAPLFYYNLIQRPNSPHIAQILVELNNVRTLQEIKKEYTSWSSQYLEEGYLVVQEFKQGPPTKAPLEIRFFSENTKELMQAKEIALETAYQMESLNTIRTDLSIGTPVVHWEIDDASLARFRSSRIEVASFILSQNKGIPVGTYRAGDRPIPILLKTSEGNFDLFELENQPLLSTRTTSVPLKSVTRSNLIWEPAYLYRKDRKTGFLLLAELNPGATIPNVVRDITGRLERKSLPKSVVWEIGGEQSESGEANRSLLAVAPIGIVVLISFLLWEFKSWIKTLVILLTVPLALIGVVPGLFLSNRPFGFLSLLGFIALVGIVVNNGILLIDAVFRAVDSGNDFSSSVRQSLTKRIRPILLTTLTTIAGLLPLGFTEATLWPPFAWTMISGLLVSTFLTLVIIPSALLLIYGEKKNNKIGKRFPGFGILILLPVFLSHSPISARDIDWKEVVSLAEESPKVKLAVEEWKRKNLESDRLKRATYYPKLGLQVEQINRDRVIAPNASIPVVAGLNPSFWSGGVEVQQTLFDPANWWAVSEALELGGESFKYLSFRAKETSQAESLLSYILIHKIKIKIDTLKDLISRLNTRYAEIRRLYAIGQVTESELLRIEQALNQSKITLFDLEEKKRISKLALKRNLGIEEDIEVVSLPTETDLRFPSEEEGAERLEILAIQKKIQALELKKKGIEYEALPKVVGKASYIYLNNNQFNTDSWSQLSFGVSLNPFDAGIRKNRIAETESEISSAREEYKDLLKALQIEKEDSKSNLSVKKRELELRQETLKKAKVASQKEWERVQSGRSNINSWIDAELLYTDEKDKGETNKLEILENMIKYRNVMGSGYGRSDLTARWE